MEHTSYLRDAISRANISLVDSSAITCWQTGLGYPAAEFADILATEWLGLSRFGTIGYNELIPAIIPAFAGTLTWP
jgi:hypothetical protein